MDARAKDVLAEYEARERAELLRMQALSPEEGMAIRDEFLLGIGRDAGEFLGQLGASCGAESFLEVGTSYGYSTLFLASAAKQAGAKLITLELSADKAAYARAQLQRAGLAGCVEFRVGDALASIAKLSETVGFVLIDIWKELYIPVFDALLPHLAEDGLIAADNMLEPAVHREDARAYQAHVRDCDRFDSILLPIGSGIELSRRRPDRT